MQNAMRRSRYRLGDVVHHATQIKGKRDEFCPDTVMSMQCRKENLQITRICLVSTLAPSCR
ncbi:hypothetical protein EV356DRAFT_301837 [Viridothelium virens]|uniref:Uncharacterized protein n=1 Tax=Viridothelium virens TaxID=1048519 RepID=A0A6A6HJV0_VIRVR|nr:hypothetical protein EV356DRAFT_301837 [Viridothelium virens]